MKAYIYVKKGVNYNLVYLMDRLVMWFAEEWARAAEWRLFITSCNDGRHMPTSFHYKDLAFDFVNPGFSRDELDQIILKFCTFYGLDRNDFDLVHIKGSNCYHIEYDNKQNVDSMQLLVEVLK